MSNRDDTGRFTPGNTAGKGNPHAAKVARLRAALLDAVTPSDIESIIQGLIAKAKGGDIHAAKIILERTLGQPLQADILERLEQLEKDLIHGDTKPIVKT